MKKISLCVIFCLILAMIPGCAQQEETYSLGCGVTLTAQGGLEEMEQAPFTTSLQNNAVVIFFLDENKQALGAQDLTLKDYAELLEVGNSLPTPFAQDAWGNLATSQTQEVQGEDYFYYITVHESNTSFWMCQMACLAEDREEYEELFAQWSATIQVADTQWAGADDSGAETYSLDCGMEITLVPGMVEMEMGGYDAFLHNNQIGVILIREEKVQDWTLADYAREVAQYNGLDPLAADEYGNPATEFTAESGGISYYYYLTAHETEDAFWLCQIYCAEALAETYGPNMAYWSASLKTAE